VIAALLLSATMALSPEARIEKFLTEIQAGRLEAARQLMSADTRRVVGEAMLKAYVDSRRRALGDITGFGKPVRVEDQYRADLRYEKGTGQAWFIVVDGGIQWYAMELPKGTAVTLDESEVVPVAQHMLATARQIGVGVLTDFISDENLAEVGQEREQIHDAMHKIGPILGAMKSYELGKPAGLENDCRGVDGSGAFEHGKAAVTLHLCWHDGMWGLRHATLTPELTPAMVERMFAIYVDAKTKISCPRNAAFPVGGRIVCRVEPPDEKARNATFLRTSESGWEIVGVGEVD
jgi:hypothetical protein